MRQELSTPVLADLNNWMQAERAKLSRHSSVAKAMDYTGSTLTGPDWPGRSSRCRSSCRRLGTSRLAPWT